MSTKQDLTETLKNCSRCYLLTKSGCNIVPFDELNQIHIDSKTKKECFIVNSSNNPDIIGHWFVISIFGGTKKKYAVIADGLSIIKHNRKVMKYINFFCNINKLKLNFINVRYQRPSSEQCGKLSLYFIYRTSMFNYNCFMKFDLLMKNNSLSNNELLLTNRVNNHFSLN